MEELLGNGKAKEQLEQVLTKEVVGNSWLFKGPEGVGKGVFAQLFAEQILCPHKTEQRQREKLRHGNHPDLHHYYPEGKIGLHSVNSLRQMSEEVYLPPLEAMRKVFIVHDADRMHPPSANALLKTFEEPSPDSVIILLSHRPAALLPTIRSRCRTVVFRPVSTEELTTFVVERYGKERKEAALIAAQAHGSVGRVVRRMEQGSDQKRERLLTLLGRGAFAHYEEMRTLLAELGEMVEQGKEEREQALRGEYTQEQWKDMTALHRDHVEKEIQGAVAQLYLSEVDELLTLLLWWYRDLVLLRLKGDLSALNYPEWREQLEHCLQVAPAIPLQRVSELVEEARLAVQRSFKLSTCLEELFLSLGYLR